MAWPPVVLDPVVGALRQRRKTMRLTQTDVAERMGLGVSAIAAWERGRKQPCLQNLHKWCAALGVELGLWEESDEV